MLRLTCSWTGGPGEVTSVQVYVALHMKEIFMSKIVPSLKATSVKFTRTRFDGRKLSFSSAQLLSLFLLNHVPKNPKKSICSIWQFFFSSLLQNWGVKWGERTRDCMDSGGRKEKTEWRCGGGGCSHREHVHLSRTFLSLRLYFSPLPLNFQTKTLKVSLLFQCELFKEDEWRGSV